MDKNFINCDILDDKYLLIGKLGEGGFGHVYLARDKLLEDRYVALKYLRLDEHSREQNLIQEMNFLSSLADPHVVGFYHHFRDGENLVLVMEYCAEGSLRDLLTAKRKVSNKLAAAWIKMLCNTLQKVHDHGIVHHDLKPENILFTREGTPKIADFGVANTRGGTFSYMPPELFLATENVSRTDCRVDIYSLGLTLLEMVSGQNPFSDLPDARLLQAKVRLDFIPDELSEWIKEIVLKAIHPKPELRFQTMQEFKEAITSKHVPYIFSRNRIQAHKAAQKAEWYLSRRRYVSALKISKQALHQDPRCLSALVTAGKCELLLKRIERAENFFEKAIKLNPRINIQKELGWIYLEKKRFPEAISMLHDHLQRQAADYEAYNLLIKAFYQTNRYEAAVDLIEIVLKDYNDNSCFENNRMLCLILLDHAPEDFSHLDNRTNPFSLYNWNVYNETPPSWERESNTTLKSKLIFQEFRHGNARKHKQNIITIEPENGHRLQFQEPIICIGRNQENDLVFPGISVSRRHCVLINYPEDVWLYDLGSTHGTYIDGHRVETPAFLERHCTISIGNSEFSISPKEGILL